MFVAPKKVEPPKSLPYWRARTQCCSQVENMFGAWQVNSGGIVRRSLDWATQKHAHWPYAPKTHLDEIKAEAQARGFHVVITGDQVVVFCHEGDLTVVC